MQTTYPATFLSILIFSQHILHTAKDLTEGTVTDISDSNC